MSAPELLPSPTELSISTLFCDGETRFIRFRRRSLGLRFYVLRTAMAIQGRPAYVGPDHDQHIVSVMATETDAHTHRVVRTLNSGMFTCPHNE